MYLEAKLVGEGRLQESIEKEASGLGEPRRHGANIFINEAEKAGIGRATTLLDEARVLVETWPKASINITCRPVPAFSSAEECIPMPELSEEAAHEIVSRLSGKSVTAALSHSWPASVKKAIKRPLFAVLLGVQEREGDMSTPRSRGELLSGLVERALERAGGDISLSQEKLERLAALSTECSGGVVTASEIARGSELQRLRDSGLVVERSGTLAFPLPLLAEWFAAHSLASGYPTPSDLTADQQCLELWRYPLVIAIGYFGSEQVTELLKPIVRRWPAFAAEVVSEGIAKWGLADDVSSPPPLECGRQLRVAMEAWVEGIGPLAPLIAPMREGGTVSPVAVSTSGARLSVAWYRDDADLEDVVPYTAEVWLDHSGRWSPKKMARLGRQPAWAWRWTLEELKLSLYKLMKKRALPVDGGMLMQEAAWRAAIFLTGYSDSYQGPISLTSIESGLQSLEYGAENQGRMVSHRDGLSYLRKELNRLKTIGAEELLPPWPARDRGYTGSGRGAFEWVAYSDDRLLARATAVYEGALDGYRRLTEQWFPKFAPRLEMAATLPARLTGIIVRRDVYGIDIAGGDSTPIMYGYLEALPHGSESVVDLCFSENSSAENDMYESWRSHKAALYHSDLGEVLGSDSATKLAYDWLWRDLKRVGWATRSIIV